MNMITIEDDIPIFKIPPCPGLIGANTNNISFISPISPPLPLTWQLAVPSDDESSGVTITPHPQFLCDTIQNSNLKTPNLNIIHKNINAINMASENCNEIEISNTHIMDTLNQFGEYENYDLSINHIINGYIRRLQAEIASIIPTDINNICFSFYHEISNKYIHFAYKLHRIIIDTEQQQTQKFSGRVLIDIINANELVHVQSQNKNKNKNKNQHENVMQICDEMIHLQFIQLVSYKTSFSSLFTMHENQPINNKFVASNDYIYSFNQNTLDAFAQYWNSNASNCNSQITHKFSDFC